MNGVIYCKWMSAIDFLKFFRSKFLHYSEDYYLNMFVHANSKEISKLTITLNKQNLIRSPTDTQSEALG